MCDMTVVAVSTIYKIGGSLIFQSQSARHRDRSGYLQALIDSSTSHDHTDHDDDNSSDDNFHDSVMTTTLTVMIMCMTVLGAEVDKAVQTSRDDNVEDDSTHS